MNQILQMENKKNSGPAPISAVVRFFAIAIIIFAIIIIALGSYHIFTQKQNNKPNNMVAQENPKPEVDITRQDDDIVISVTHTLPILEIVYNWNGEEEITIDTENRTTLAEKISLPYGTNTLNLSVIDVNGEETKFVKEYIVEGQGKPVIELKLTTDNQIKITVQDTTNLQYVAYSWNNDEETKIEINENNLNNVEQEIEIPAGQNTLKVQAVNENSVQVAKELEVKGVKKPIVKLTKEDGYLVIRAEDEVGMKIINYTLNGQRYQINYGNKTLIEYKQKIPEGESNLELTAENQDGGTATIKAKILN